MKLIKERKLIRAGKWIKRVRIKKSDNPEVREFVRQYKLAKKIEMREHPERFDKIGKYKSPGRPKNSERLQLEEEMRKHNENLDRILDKTDIACENIVKNMPISSLPEPS